MTKAKAVAIKAAPDSDPTWLLDSPRPRWYSSPTEWRKYLNHWMTPEQKRIAEQNSQNRQRSGGRPEGHMSSHYMGSKGMHSRMHEEEEYKEAMLAQHGTDFDLWDHAKFDLAVWESLPSVKAGLAKGRVLAISTTLEAAALAARCAAVAVPPPPPPPPPSGQETPHVVALTQHVTDLNQMVHALLNDLVQMSQQTGYALPPIPGLPSFPTGAASESSAGSTTSTVLLAQMERMQGIPAPPQTQSQTQPYPQKAPYGVAQHHPHDPQDPPLVPQHPPQAPQDPPHDDTTSLD
ncbi:hypothetical protein LIER_25592 [Lithospermum erythrorhizon]|uniref:Uncharacterized protein n=1 Tax=Lithospermum erythrorhizon TaxID=34254 RepID=A0AAV3R9D8_LITER